MQDIIEMPSVELARALMADDPAVFKAGYTLDNAVLAVKDIHKLSDEDAEQLITDLTTEREMTDEEFQLAKDHAEELGAADGRRDFADARDNVIKRVVLHIGATVGHPDEAADIFEVYEETRRNV